MLEFNSGRAKRDMKIPLVDLKAQYRSIKKEIDASIETVIKTSCFINGKDNELFEKKFAKYCDVKYAIGVASGSVALDLALEALEVLPGDEIICPSHTFTATAEAIIHRKAKPVFVDISEETYNIDVKLIEQKINKKTKGIIVVHLYGNPADMDLINEIATKHKLWVIEDAAQAHGAKYMNKRVGSLGDIACFSFFPAKNLGCYGDGGAVVTNNSELAEKIKLLKDHGRTEKYIHKEIGYGLRLDNLQAAILRTKLKHLDKWNEKRRKIAERYTKNLSEKYITPNILREKGVEHVYYVYTLRHSQRDMITEFLKTKEISTGIYYPVPLHLQKAYRYLNYKKGDLPITEKICKEIFSIPIFPELEKRKIERITNTLLKVA